jgi:hypothetical protein
MSEKRFRRVTRGASAALIALGFLAGCGKFFVSGNTLVAVSLSPSNPTIAPSKTQQFTATGSFGDGTSRDVTSTVTWSSSSPNIASINSSGLATAGAGTGNTTITATSGSVSGSTTLTVSTTTVSSISVTAANGSTTLNPGTQAQLTATATLSSGGTQDVTNSATWTSSNTAVATVSNTGLVTPLTAGSATITASSGGVQGQISITVI